MKPRIEICIEHASRVCTNIYLYTLEFDIPCLKFNLRLGTKKSYFRVSKSASLGCNYLTREKWVYNLCAIEFTLREL